MSRGWVRQSCWVKGTRFPRGLWGGIRLLESKGEPSIRPRCEGLSTGHRSILSGKKMDYLIKTTITAYLLKQELSTSQIPQKVAPEGKNKKLNSRITEENIGYFCIPVWKGLF